MPAPDYETGCLPLNFTEAVPEPVVPPKAEESPRSMAPLAFIGAGLATVAASAKMVGDKVSDKMVETGVGEKVKTAGVAVAQGAKTAGVAVAQGAKTAGVAVAQGAKTAGVFVFNKTKDAATTVWEKGQDIKV